LQRLVVLDDQHPQRAAGSAAGGAAAGEQGIDRILPDPAMSAGGFPAGKGAGLDHVLDGAQREAELACGLGGADEFTLRRLRVGNGRHPDTEIDVTG